MSIICPKGKGYEEKYEVILGNFEDLEKEIVNKSVELMLYRPREYADFRYYKATLNKRLINLLTAARLYIDHIIFNPKDI